MGAKRNAYADFLKALPLLLLWQEGPAQTCDTQTFYDGSSNQQVQLDLSGLGFGADPAANWGVLDGMEPPYLKISGQLPVTQDWSFDYLFSSGEQDLSGRVLSLWYNANGTSTTVQLSLIGAEGQVSAPVEYQVPNMSTWVLVFDPSAVALNGVDPAHVSAFRIVLPGISAWQYLHLFLDNIQLQCPGTLPGSSSSDAGSSSSAEDSDTAEYAYDPPGLELLEAVNQDQALRLEAGATVVLTGFPTDWEPNTLSLHFVPEPNRQMDCEVEFDDHVYHLQGWYTVIHIPFVRQEALMATVTSCADGFDAVNATVRYWLDNSNQRTTAERAVDSGMMDLSEDTWADAFGSEQWSDWRIVVPDGQPFQVEVQMVSGSASSVQFSIDDKEYGLQGGNTVVQGALLNGGMHRIGVVLNDQNSHLQVRWKRISSAGFASVQSVANETPVVLDSVHVGTIIHYDYGTTIPGMEQGRSVYLLYDTGTFVDEVLPSVQVAARVGPFPYLKSDEVPFGPEFVISGAIRDSQKVVFALPVPSDVTYDSSMVLNVFLESEERDSWSWYPVDSVKDGFAYFQTRHFSHAGLYLSSEATSPMEMFRPTTAQAMLATGMSKLSLYLNQEDMDPELVQMLASATVPSASGGSSTSTADQARAAAQAKAQLLRDQIAKMKNKAKNKSSFEFPELGIKEDGYLNDSAMTVWMEGLERSRNSWPALGELPVAEDITYALRCYRGRIISLHECGDSHDANTCIAPAGLYCVVYEKKANHEQTLADMKTSNSNLNQILMDAVLSLHTGSARRYEITGKDKLGRVMVKDKVLKTEVTAISIKFPFQYVLQKRDAYNRCDTDNTLDLDGCLPELKRVFKALQDLSGEEADDKILQSPGLLLKLSLLMQADHSFWHQFGAAVFTFSDYYWRTVQALGKLDKSEPYVNNILLKGMAAIHYNKKLYGASPVEPYLNKILSGSLFSQEGGYAEGTGYLLYANEELLSAYALLVAQKRLAPSKIPERFRRSGYWLLNLAKETGRIPGIDDGNAGIKAWLAPYALVTQNLDFKNWQNRFFVNQDPDGNNQGFTRQPGSLGFDIVCGYADTLDECKTVPHDAVQLLTFPYQSLRYAEDALSWKSSIRDRIAYGGVASIIQGTASSSGRPGLAALRMIAEGSGMESKGTGHDQQDNGSVTLTWEWEADGQHLSWDLIQDLPYPGNDLRTSTSGYCSHNAVLLTSETNCGARANVPFTQAEAKKTIPDIFNNAFDDAEDWSYFAGYTVLPISLLAMGYAQASDSRCDDELPDIKDYMACRVKSSLFHAGSIPAGSIGSLITANAGLFAAWSEINFPDRTYTLNGATRKQGYRRYVARWGGDFIVADRIFVPSGTPVVQQFHLPYANGAVTSGDYSGRIYQAGVNEKYVQSPSVLTENSFDNHTMPWHDGFRPAIRPYSFVGSSSASLYGPVTLKGDDEYCQYGDMWENRDKTRINCEQQFVRLRNKASGNIDGVTTLVSMFQVAGQASDLGQQNGWSWFGCQSADCFYKEEGNATWVFWITSKPDNTTVSFQKSGATVSTSAVAVLGFVKIENGVVTVQENISE